jgi:hypothetical protein
VFGSKKSKLEFKATEPFHTDLEGTRIVREGSRYFVIIPQNQLYQEPENQRIDAVGLDPGVHTFKMLLLWQDSQNRKQEKNEM